MIAAAFAPVLTRIYGPDAFGVLGAFLAIVAILSNIAGANYPIAIVLSRDDHEARGIAKLSLFLSIGLGVVLAMVVIAIGSKVEPWFSARGFEGVGGLAALLPVTIVLTTALSISQQWLIRKHRFSVTAKASIGQSAISGLAKMGVGLLTPVAPALVGVAAAAPALHVSLLWPGLRDLVRPVDRKPSIPKQLVELQKLARRYKDFPLYRAPQNLLSAFGRGLPTLLLASTAGAAAAGFYAITQSVMGLPSVLIGKSVGDVFYPKITRAVQEGDSPQRMIVKATSVLALFGSVPLGLVAIFGPFLFRVVFGEGWAVAGEYARWLSVFYFMNLINKPSMAAIAPLGLQKQLLLYEVIAITAKLVGLLSGLYGFNSPVVAVALFSIAGAGAYLVLIVYVVNAAGQETQA